MVHPLRWKSFLRFIKNTAKQRKRYTPFLHPNRGNCPHSLMVLRAYNIYVNSTYPKVAGTMDSSTWESICEKRSPMNGRVRSWNTTRSIWIRHYRSTKSTSSPNNLKRKTMRTVVRTRQSARIATKPSARRGSLVSRQRRQEPRLRTSANTTRHRLSGLWTLMGSLWSSTLTRSYRRSLIKKRVWNNLISCRGQYLRSTGSRGLAL